MRHYIFVLLCFGAASVVQAGNPLRRMGHGVAEIGRGMKDGVVVTAGAVGAGTRKTAGAVKSGFVKTAETSEEGVKRVGRGGQSVGEGFKDAGKEIAGRK